MTRETILDLAKNYMDEATNYVQAADAVEPSHSGLRIFEAPILGVAAASDSAFDRLTAPQAVGAHFSKPGVWLDGAKSVLSFFAPFTAPVRESNSVDPENTSYEWFYGRREGQEHLDKLGEYLKAALEKEGYRAIVPVLDERFLVNRNPQTPNDPVPVYNTNWPERHVAYVCGLGTFGLHTCLITDKGTAGRFISLVTDWDITPDSRDYDDYMDYCTKCGVCIKNCPADALDDSGKKDKIACSQYAHKMYQRFHMIGCGKCQAGVPCEAKNPSKA